MVNKVDRARQFLPFDALSGLQEEYRKKEIEYEIKKELSEESLSELEKEFHKAEIGKEVKIKYYKNGRYIYITGKITKIDNIKKKIQINNTENINICDILKIFVQ